MTIPVVLTLMKNTFTNRRDYVLESGDSVGSFVFIYKGFTYPYSVSKLIEGSGGKSYFFYTQIEQEVDLILQKKDVVKNASQDWRLKWIPGILKKCDQLSGKQLKMYHQYR